MRTESSSCFLFQSFAFSISRIVRLMSQSHRGRLVLMQLLLLFHSSACQSIAPRSNPFELLFPRASTLSCAYAPARLDRLHIRVGVYLRAHVVCLNATCL